MINITQLLMGLEAPIAEDAGAGSLLGLLLPMVLMFAVFYFLLIRPQRKKDKKVKSMLAA